MELAMLSRRKTCADRIKHPDAGTEAAPLNPLSAIAPLFRVRPEIQDVCRFALQWEVVHEAEPTGFAQFHIVTNGNCLLTYGDSAFNSGPATALVNGFPV
jgi:AraC family transcriptional activator of mtrCDE